MEGIDVEKEGAESIYQKIRGLAENEKERLNHHNRFSPSICTVNSTLRDLSPSSFNPRVVAIGPIHKGDTKLQGIENHKVTYLHDLFLHLPSTRDQEMNECVQMVYGKVGEIRACYAEEFMKDYDDFEVAKMMVIDGCFILGFILRALASILPANDPFFKNILLCAKPVNDPIFDNKLFSMNVMRDLVLLENQIPFFVLHDIFKCTILKHDSASSLHGLVLSFLKPIHPFHTSSITINDGAATNYDHILGLLQKSCQPAHAMPFRFSVSRCHSVVELTRAGVNFKRNQDKRWLLAMEFKASWFPCIFWSWGKPTLRMPVLLIEDHTESVLRNLIAYEQCSPLIHSYISSYAAAMHMLVDTQNDVVKMVESEVLKLHLGTNEDAANMISSICKNVILEEFYYDAQWNQMHGYMNRFWPKNRRTYFRSPWNFINLVAGFILFALTVVQTYYTIYPV